MLKYLIWIIKGRKIIHYSGFCCGCCGKWNAIPFDIPEYKSSGDWWDTWGLCPTNNPCKIEDD